MRLSRRQFLGFIGGAAGLSGCAKTKDAMDSIASIDMMPGGGDDFTFAAINDLHVLDAKSVGIVRKAVMSINENETIRFTVVLGDIATDGEVSELKLAKSALDDLQRPYLTIPGNHDVPPKVKEPLHNFELVYEDPHWKDEREGWLFIGMNTCEGTKSDVTVSEEEIAWLQHIAKRTNQNRPIALFGHHPFNPNTKAYRVINADEVLGIFSEHNLKLVAAGHYHGNQIEEQNGTMFTTTACCSTTRDNFDDTPEKGYRLFHIKGDTIETEFVVVDA
jgi:3',5'-cyclic AMP phosphodiesterase CpdA